MRKEEEKFPEHLVAYMEKCKKEKNPESQLISILHKVQGHFGFLSKESLEEVSWRMQIPSAKVTGVASFYHYFCLKQRGRLVITICTGTACYVKGAMQVAKKIKQELGIEFGETTKDGLFTLEEARCLGTCALAPVLKVGDNIHPQMTPDQVPALLESYFERDRKGEFSKSDKEILF